VLVKFSQHLQNVRQKTDYVSRYAGDEFAILTLRSKEETESMVDFISLPIQVNDVTISPSIGVLFGDEVDDFFELSFRDIVSRTSLLSTKNKMRVLNSTK
jgi:GGDEF domain-containing protein